MNHFRKNIQFRKTHTKRNYGIKLTKRQPKNKARKIFKFIRVEG